jgi:hypothetical protein
MSEEVLDDDGAADLQALIRGRVPSGAKAIIASVEIVEAGTLALPSGAIAFCDLGGAARARQVKPLFSPGSYPVKLCVAVRKGSSDRRVMAIHVPLSKDAVSEWRLTTDDEDELDGVGIDSGMVILCDVGALPDLQRKEEEDGELDDLMKAAAASYVDTYQWANFALASSYNVIASSTGVGDGFYPIALGYNKNGALSAITMCCFMG